MSEVAERAGVSVTTVSHVVNQTRPVSPELTNRVQAAMQELGYQPNRLARSLRLGKTLTIGMIIPDGVNPFFAEVARGIEDTGFEHGYSVILCNSDGDLEKELHYTKVLNAKRVDGIIFVAVGVSHEHIQMLQARKLPVVVVDREIPGVNVSTVITDNQKGGWLATNHLIELGHRRIACIAGPNNLTPSAARVTGYQQALKAHNIELNETLILRGDFQYQSGYRLMKQLLENKTVPTAVFACNDLMATGALCAAVEMGFRVPEDISIVGFDDIDLASYTTPPLTTIRQPKYEMGVFAVGLLLDQIKDTNPKPERHILDTELVTRKSSAAVMKMEHVHA